MLKYYKKGDALTFPSGATYTYEKLCAHDAYNILGLVDCAIDEASDGVTSSITRLAPLKERYGIAEKNPDTAVELIIAAQAAEEESQKQEQANLNDIQAQLNALAGTEV